MSFSTDLLLNSITMSQLFIFTFLCSLKMSGYRDEVFIAIFKK